MSQKHFRIQRLPLLAGLLAAGLSIPALCAVRAVPDLRSPARRRTALSSSVTARSSPPAGTQVNLGIRVRAKAIALNPTGNHTAAVLVMGASGSNGKAVEVFNTQTGAVLQTYNRLGNTDPDGSNTGITYSPDGKYLLFSQDSNYGTINKSMLLALPDVDPSQA